MGRDRAAYMRGYRAKRRLAHEEYDEAKPLIGHLKSRITELEDEVRHLKSELAKRATPMVSSCDCCPNGIHLRSRFNSRPFTPVPKSGK